MAAEFEEQSLDFLFVAPDRLRFVFLKALPAQASCSLGLELNDSAGKDLRFASNSEEYRGQQETARDERDEGLCANAQESLHIDCTTTIVPIAALTSVKEILRKKTTRTCRSPSRIQPGPWNN